MIRKSRIYNVAIWEKFKVNGRMQYRLLAKLPITATNSDEAKKSARLQFSDYNPRNLRAEIAGPNDELHR